MLLGSESTDPDSDHDQNIAFDHVLVAPVLVHHRAVCIVHCGDVDPVPFRLCPRWSGTSCLDTFVGRTQFLGVVSSGRKCAMCPVESPVSSRAASQQPLGGFASALRCDIDRDELDVLPARRPRLGLVALRCDCAEASLTMSGIKWVYYSTIFDCATLPRSDLP